MHGECGDVRRLELGDRGCGLTEACDGGFGVVEAVWPLGEVCLEEHLYGWTSRGECRRECERPLIGEDAGRILLGAPDGDGLVVAQD
jgi:hypothetical protein